MSGFFSKKKIYVIYAIISNVFYVELYGVAMNRIKWWNLPGPVSDSDPADCRLPWPLPLSAESLCRNHAPTPWWIIVGVINETRGRHDLARRCSRTASSRHHLRPINHAPHFGLVGRRAPGRPPYTRRSPAPPGNITSAVFGHTTHIFHNPLTDNRSL